MELQTKLLACVVNLGLALHGLPAHAGVMVPTGPALAGRLAPPAQDVVAQFAAAGMRDIRTHALTPAEQLRVEQALASLPALHRLVLEKGLRRLSFVDGLPGLGSGLFSAVAGTGQFDITLRASLIGESLDEFLTAKERRLFAPDGSGMTVTVEGSGTDALTYVLLHETTHAVDRMLNVTEDRGGPFTLGIWQDGNTLVPPLAASLAARTRFRGGQPFPAASAPAVYGALLHTPFASLYATAAPGEDFAELLAWHRIASAHGGGLTITLRDAGGAPVGQYEPMKSPGLAARRIHAEALLRRAETEDGRRDLLRRLDGAGGGRP